MSDVKARVDEVTRASYGRLLALLSAPTRDIAAAEDALADAVEAALRTWPESGVPTNPEGWLFAVARNKLRDRYRSAAYRTSVELDDASAAIPAPDVETGPIEDRRLELLFVCAHPAINRNVRTPLMLQTVLGVDAAQIAQAYAIPASTMAQRLVRRSDGSGTRASRSSSRNGMRSRGGSRTCSRPSTARSPWTGRASRA